MHVLFFEDCMNVSPLGAFVTLITVHCDTESVFNICPIGNHESSSLSTFSFPINRALLFLGKKTCDTKLIISCSSSFSRLRNFLHSTSFSKHEAGSPPSRYHRCICLCGFSRNNFPILTSSTCIKLHCNERCCSTQRTSGCKLARRR